jgi:hypothetical protein
MQESPRGHDQEVIVMVHNTEEVSYINLQVFPC